MIRSWLGARKRKFERKGTLRWFGERGSVNSRRKTKSGKRREEKRNEEVD
jgi:hypothetical protein